MSAAIGNFHEERDKALGNALREIEKSYGKGAVMRLEDGAIGDIEVISTGSIGVDRALGVGGIPRGRVIEIYGPESSGKTTLALHLIAEAQKDGGRAAFIDAEHALDPGYAEALGVVTSDLLLSQPDHGEQALEITEKLISSCAVDLVVVDSVAALTPKAEIEGEMGDSHMGLQARLMSQALRKLTSAIQQSNSTLVFINQLRHKIGVMFGSPETTTGGNALKFYSSVRIDIRRIGAVKDGDEIVGNHTRIKIVKNKVAPPFKMYEAKIVFGKGVYRPAELIDLGVELGFIKQSGSWFSQGDKRLAQGKQNAYAYLEENPEEAAALEADIRREIFGTDETEEEPTESDKNETDDEND